MAELVAVDFDPFKKSTTPDDFSARYGSAAEKAGKALGVDPKVVLGQWGLETGWGKSVIPGTNNLGNIKDFSGKGTAATDNMTGSRDKYRAYESADQFVDDYVSLIQRKYPGAVNAKTPEDFAKALKSGGYAEDPGYVAKVTTAAKMTPVKAIPSDLGYGNRPDGSPKGRGFLGELKRPDGGISTEVSVGVNIGGKEMDIPLLVPTLSPTEIERVLAMPPGQQPPEDIVRKAAEFAKQRITQGKSVFAGASESSRRGATLVPVDFDPFAEATPPAAEASQAPEQVASQPSGLSRFVGGAVKGTKDLAGGLVRGAGSIGATLLAPGDVIQDAMAGRPLLATNKARRAEMDAGLQTAGVDTNSLNYGAGKLTSEIAGTAGTGNVLGAGAKAAGAGPKVVNALRSGGMTLGQPGGSVAGNLLTRAGAGAAVGGTSAAMVDPETAGTGALIGGALPVVTQAAGMVGRGIGRTIAGKPIAPEVKALADRATQLGIDIPADRLVNSKPLNALASSLDYVPGSGRAATMDKMSSQLNTALSKTFGQNSDNVTGALRKAQSELGGKFDDVLKSNTVKVDEKFITDLADAANMASRELGSDGAGIISKQVDDILDKAATGEINGQAAYNIKRTLDRISNRSTPEAFYARELKKKLMDALNRSLGADEAAAFANVRKQYSNMLSLENIAQNGAEGNISIARLANMKNINNPELQELADISAQFLKSREGAHGAAQRVGAGALALGLSGPQGLAAGMATGRAANTLLNSSVMRNAVTGTPQNNRLLQFARSPEVEQLLYRAAPVAGSRQ